MYYPLSEIVGNLYTDGSEFIFPEDGTFYKGPYFLTSDGKFFTEKTLLPNSKEIIRASQTNSPSLYTPDYFIPEVSEDDYRLGYIVRQVIKRVNSGPDSIIEVKKQDYYKFRDNPLYIRASFKWVIVGPALDNLSNPLYPIYGTATINKKTIDGLREQIPGIEHFFKNYTEFIRNP